MSAEQPKVNMQKSVTTSNLSSLAWSAGYRGVAGLARAMGRHRVTVWRAARWPGQFGPTYSTLVKLLLCKEN